LEVVRLPEFANITDRGLLQLIGLSPSLKLIRLANLPKLSGKAFQGLAKARLLGALFVSDCPGFTDMDLEKLGALRHLKWLVIRACPGISAAGIAAFQAVVPGCRIEWEH
jgi:hypothetical protein